jgi:hypothetical protein
VASSNIASGTSSDIGVRGEEEDQIRARRSPDGAVKITDGADFKLLSHIDAVSLLRSPVPSLMGLGPIPAALVNGTRS